MTESIQNSNLRSRFNVLIAVMWLALPFIGYRYWSVWGRLPAHMATHFGTDGRPNGWMTPQQSLTFSIAMIAILLTVFTSILAYMGSRSQRLGVTSWSAMGLFYVLLGV